VKPSFLLISLLLSIVVARPGTAAELLTPFFTRNQNPFVQIFGLPSAESSRLLPAGSLAVSVVIDAANSFSSGTTAAEAILLDGETYRSTLSWRYGVSDHLEIGADLPYISHRGGNFDGFIDWWHNVSGLPDGGRKQAARNLLRYRYLEDGGERVAILDSASGLGDLMLAAAVPVYGRKGERRLAALRVTLKLPTGSTSSLMGSGSTDFSLRLSGEDRQTFSPWDISLFGAAGVLLLTGGEIIAERQRHVVGFGTLGFGWQPYSWLALKFQVDAHSAFYDSELAELGDFSAQLVMGGSLGLHGELVLDLAVSEDIIVYTAPDVVFHVALRHPF
jgi:hypothetical protein